ncbi:hypothetical protein [Chryseobacterium sp. HSC-36S06]|uniref:hypothetical protein n=1 Tax=Chryseobacterium sp. HSC-36S06 TaxID=2910970 RepID=UPI001A284529|nr:hypothetical protein [Chryseobacterium sp. HSC-36S06]MBH1959840.1 hypothetical protein [Flavobacteriia bacterium]MBH2023109.1 hypothetical protein [Flavobacteriales bacterium]MCP2038467.1 hypothetical protein [Chryseobacterium sp. HSC-36S06]
MKNLFTFLCFFFAYLGFAQVNPSSINSLNVLDYYQRNHHIQEPVNASQSIVLQIGNENIIEVRDQRQEYLELSQVGNDNTIYFTNPNNYPTNAEINIQGSGNYVDILGSNSISDGMKININANDMTIYMRNY